MRLSLRGDGLLERLALWADLVPRPAGEAWGGLATAGVLLAAVQVGLTQRLAAGPASVAELAADLDLEPAAAQLIVNCLVSSRYVRRRGERYALSRSARRWLDPAATGSVAHFVAATADYWAWWPRLSETLRTGQRVGHHEAPPDDPYWRRYLLGQFDLARLCAGEVSAKLRVPRGARSVLDLGGGHGWYSAALCRRHPGLTSTVLDLPGSSRVGREIIAGLGMSDRVVHREGDALTAELGGPYDVVLCFNLVHHLGAEQTAVLLTRIHDALAPGGVVAILDGFADAARPAPAAVSYFDLFAYLTSGSRAFDLREIRGWLRAAGLHPTRVAPIRRIPGLALHEATRDGSPGPSRGGLRRSMQR